MIQHSNDDGTSLEGTIQWLIQHSNFPTFDQFKKNPDIWRGRTDEIFESADVSSITFKKQIKAQVYYWRDQYECKSLEQVQRVAKEEGYAPWDLAMEPLVRPIHGSLSDHDMEVVVRFWPKWEFKRRGGVVPHD